MTAVRQIVNSNVLRQIIKLPKSLQDRPVEIIVMPVNERRTRPKFNRKQLDSLITGSNTQALSGVLPANADIGVENLREERRRTYECAD